MQDQAHVAMSLAGVILFGISALTIGTAINLDARLRAVEATGIPIRRCIRGWGKLIGQFLVRVKYREIFSITKEFNYSINA